MKDNPKPCLNRECEYWEDDAKYTYVSPDAESNCIAIDTVYQLHICKHYSPKQQQETCNCDRNSGDIDADIKPIVDALNNAGIKTDASCCGHTFQPSRVSLIHNGVEKELLLCTYAQAQAIGKLFPDINGEQQPEEKREICPLCKGSGRFAKIADRSNEIEFPDEDDEEQPKEEQPKEEEWRPRIFLIER